MHYPRLPRLPRKRGRRLGLRDARRETEAGPGGRRPRCSRCQDRQPRRGRASWPLSVWRTRCAVAEPKSAREQFLEGGVLADWIEVGITFKEWAGLLREFDRASKVRDRLVLLTGEAFAAGDVEEQVGVRWGRPPAARVLDPPPQRNRPPRRVAAVAQTAPSPQASTAPIVAPRGVGPPRTAARTGTGPDA